MHKVLFVGDGVRVAVGIRSHADHEIVVVLLLDEFDHVGGEVEFCLWIPVDAVWRVFEIQTEKLIFMFLINKRGFTLKNAHLIWVFTYFIGIYRVV